MMKKERPIGEIGNYYGGLSVKTETVLGEDRYFWSIEDYGGHDWQEIPKYLFDALNRFEDQANPEEM